MIKVAIVQKCPSNVNYSAKFKIDDLDVFNLSSTKVSRLLKRDVDLVVQSKEQHDVGFCPELYDWVILVGTEALKMFTKATAVTDYTGKVAPGRNGETNFIASISPAVLAFKPEAQPVFDETVLNIHRIMSGTAERVQEGEYTYFQDTEGVAEYLNYVLNSDHKVIALDTETSALAAREGYLLGLSMSHKVGQGMYVDADYLDETCVSLIQKIIDTKRTVLHNAKFDMHFLTYHFGLKFLGRDVHDTMLMHYLLDERQGTHGLKSLTMQYGVLGDYDRELDEHRAKYCKTYGIKVSDFTYDLFPWDLLKVYAAKDTDATIFLYYKFYPILEANSKLLSCYNNIMLPGLHLLTKIEDRGAPISVERLQIARRLLDSKIVKLKEELYKFSEVHEFEKIQGDQFNPNSPAQLRRLLFDLIGITPTGKLTDTGNISTDADVLKELSSRHKIPEIILGIRQLSKLKNTYIDKLIPAVDSDKRVRTGFNLSNTTSGRLSSSGKFNMQQLPRDNPIIKGCVKAPKGYKIVAVDLSTAETYYAAVLSGDKSMQEVFTNMKLDPKKYPDFHSNIAHIVFNLKCKPAEVKKQFPALRQAAKAITFGILFGSGPASVAESVNAAFLEEGQEATCTVEDASGYIQDYFGKFPKLRKWIDARHAEIKANGFVYTHFGRKRRLHNVNSVDRAVASKEVRSGFNALIQSVSSDHLLLGAIDADNEILEKGLDVEIFALVHDSVVAVVKEEIVPEYLEIIVRSLQKDRGCSIPGCPIGVEEDSEPGGSEDYSCGKLAKVYPELAAA